METFVFMIIIGIVSVIFRNAKGKTGQSSNKTFSMNTFEEMKTLVKKQLNYDEIQTSRTYKAKKKPSEIPLDNNRENLENKYLQLKQGSEGNRSGITMAEPKSIKERINSEEEIGILPALDLDEKTLINGIIWSEILGEPRAKKPYRPRNR